MLSLIVMHSNALWNSFKDNRGFTIVELLVVLFILGIIGSIAFNAIQNKYVDPEVFN